MKQHSTDGASLVFGLIFLAIPAGWLISRTADLGAATVGWSVAIGLIVIGLLGILAAFRKPVEDPAAVTTTEFRAPEAADGAAPSTYTSDLGETDDRDGTATRHHGTTRNGHERHGRDKTVTGPDADPPKDAL